MGLRRRIETGMTTERDAKLATQYVRASLGLGIFIGILIVLLLTGAFIIFGG